MNLPSISVSAGPSPARPRRKPGGNLVSDQAPKNSESLVTDQARAQGDGGRRRLARSRSSPTQQRQLLAACDTPRRQTELMALLGVTHRTQFRTFHLQPLIDGGLLQPQFPDSPRHPRQRYSLTPVGAEIVGRQHQSRRSRRMTSQGKSAGAGELFIEGSGQLRLVDKSAEQQALEKGKVECLGMRFDSEDARRAYFTEKLREKLADPEFRKTPGFPKGSDEDIIRMSDPPWYTACPNPFLSEFVGVYGKPYDPKERYERDPFAVDTSVGKTDALYKAHGYHTKVPHLAIVPIDSPLHGARRHRARWFCRLRHDRRRRPMVWLSSPSFRKQLEGEWSKRGCEAAMGHAPGDSKRPGPCRHVHRCKLQYAVSADTL